jgi:hypothetical protein
MKNGSVKLLERAGENEEVTASKAKPSRKPSKPVALARKRTLPLLGAGSIQIIDMRAVLK